MEGVIGMVVFEDRVCECGAVFWIEEGSVGALCGVCARAARKAESKRDGLECRRCEGRMLVPAVKGLCGLCDPDWVAV